MKIFIRDLKSFLISTLNNLQMETASKKTEAVSNIIIINVLRQ